MMYRNNCLNEYVYVNWSNFQLSFLRANWEMFRTVSKSCDVPRASKPSARQATSSVYFRKPHLQDIESERIESDDNVTITSSNFLRKEKWSYSLSESFPSDERNFIDFRKKKKQSKSLVQLNMQPKNACFARLTAFPLQNLWGRNV